MQILKGELMAREKKIFYCEADYSRVEALPFKGRAYHVSIGGGSDFKAVGVQSDRTYRRLFTEIGDCCEEGIRKADVNSYGGFQFVLCGGTSFIHGSAGKGKKYEEPLGKAHLHAILYTNCNALVGKEDVKANGHKLCIGGLIERFLKGEKEGFGIGVEVIPFDTAEVMDYILQQRVEPEPLWCSSVPGLRFKSLLKVLAQYPKKNNYRANLLKWDRNIRKAVEQILESNTVLFEPVRVLANPTSLKMLGCGGVLECQLLQKAVTLANIRYRKKNAVRLEIAGLQSSFETWLKYKPLIAHYLHRVYWNGVLVDKVNAIAGEPVLEKLVTYARYKGDGEKIECWTRPYVDGRTAEGRKLKEEGWRTERLE